MSVDLVRELDVPLDDGRRLAIIRLLETRDEGLPVPRLRSRSSSGFVGGRDGQGRPLRSLSCPDCLANGRVMFGCETCGGSGEVLDDGPDPYATNVVLPFGHDPTRHDLAAERDRQIDRLKQQTRPARSEAELLADANRRGYAWEETRRAMYSRFDYAELDRALDWLRNIDEGAYHALHSVYVYAWLEELSPATEVALERGLVLLHERLPDPLRAPGLERKAAALMRRDRRHRS